MNLEFLAYFGTYFLIGLWLLFSIWVIFNYKKSNPYILHSIPSVFTTLGVFGTFAGIIYGLWYFDVENITNSIPQLLSGLKTAFFTSIVGILLSLIFSNIVAHLKKRIDDEVPPKPTSELNALQRIIELQEQFLQQNSEFSKESSGTFLKESQIIQQLISTQTEQITIGLNEQRNELESQFASDKALKEKYNEQIVSHLDTLTNELKSAQKEQSANLQMIITNGAKLIESVDDNHTSLRKKFDEFGSILAKNNTEALVKAMESVITDFNTQMNELISRLVKENFQELNQSVKQLNEWQKENKLQVEKLISQFKEITNQFQISSEKIKEITENTTKLTSENGNLSLMIKELQAVLIEDTKFKELINKVSDTIEILERTTTEFENTTNKLNDWIRGEKNLKDAVTILIEKLREIERIKDINGEFWTNTRKQMEEGVSLVSRANSKLANDVQVINGEFYQRLNTTLQSLDELIQQFILNGTKR